MKDRFVQVVRLARDCHEPSDVPFAFETRIMARIRSSKASDVWTVWFPTMWKAAACGLAILACTGLYVRYTENHPPDLLAGDLERTVLASVNFDETW